MKYCHECGTALIDKELEHEGIVPYCPNCQDYRFPMYNVAVSMIIINEENQKILLVKQYGKDYFRLVAGYVNRTETLEHAAVRELKEETGYSAGRVKYLGCINPSVAYSEEVIHLYLMTGLVPGLQSLDDDEALEVELIPFDEVYRMAAEGELTDAKTIAGIFMAKHQR